MSIQFPNLGINLDYVGKSIRIFGFEITFFGLLIAAGMLLGLGFIVLEARRCGEKEDDYLEMMILSLVTGVIGARALYVCFSWNLYKGNVNQIFNLRGGGLAFYGGLFGGMLGAAIYCAIRKKAFMQMEDTACMGLVIAQIIGRWGDFFNRESFGEYTNSIFAMQLPLSAVRSSEVTSVMRENLETIGGVSYIQVHPVFLYESLWCLLLFLLMLVWKRKKRFHGEVFLRYLAGYGLGRFILEYLRTDKLTIPGTSIGICQVISAALFLICAVVVTVESSMAKKRTARRRRRREQDYEAQEMAARQAEAEEYRDRLKLERAFADEKKGSVPEAYSSSVPVYESQEEESTQDDPKEEETAGSASDQMEEAAKDGYEEVSENQEAVAGEDAETEETASEEYEENEGDEAVSEEALQEDGSLQKDDSAYEEVEETAAPDGTEAASAADPSLSEDDEWLYSKPRRFAKKPANEQKN